jgi:hypothetical protein
MKKWIIVVIAIAGFIGLVVAACFASYVSAFNYGNQMEQSLAASQTDNRNIFAQYGQKVAEVAQVPAMYRDDLEKVVTAAIEGRYGEGGSRAAFQWIQEQNPTIDASLYKSIQQVIEAGRSNFENGQRRMIDLRRQYQTKLGSFWFGLWLRIAGYPKVDLAKFDIVSTDKANAVFEAGKEIAPIQLR